MQTKLATEIIELSIADTWNNAKSEWFFEYAYQSDEAEECLCGHYPIKNICVIKNRENGNFTEVGNICINKFLEIKSGNKIFQSITKIKGDKTRSISKEALEYIKSKNGISEYEYNFYSDIIRKRNLSEKQLDLKNKINNKFIVFTSYEANSILKRINKVLKWASSRKSFDTSFVESLKQNFNKYGKLSAKQNESLNNIVNRFKI